MIVRHYKQLNRFYNEGNINYKNVLRFIYTLYTIIIVHLNNYCKRSKN